MAKSEEAVIRFSKMHSIFFQCVNLPEYSKGSNFSPTAMSSVFLLKFEAFQPDMEI